MNMANMTTATHPSAASAASTALGATPLTSLTMAGTPRSSASVPRELVPPSSLSTTPTNAARLGLQSTMNGVPSTAADTAPHTVENVMDELMLQYLKNRGYQIVPPQAPAGPRSDGDVDMPLAPYESPNGVQSPHGAAESAGIKNKQLQQEQASVTEEQRRRFLGVERINQENPNTQALVSLEKYASQLGLTTESCAANHILFYGLTGGDPATFVDAYTKFMDWVCNSLDMYKYELHAVTFPVFVHCYLDLLTKGYVDAAKEFFVRFAQDHMRLHVDELRQLSLLFSPDHVRSSEYAQQVLHSKFNVHVSLLSFELLNAFLSHEQLFLMLTIVNERINLIVTNNQPGMVLEQLEDASTFEGRAIPSMVSRTASGSRQDWNKTSDDVARVLASSSTPNESEIAVALTTGAYDVEYMVQTAGGHGKTLEDLHAIKIKWGVLPAHKLHKPQENSDGSASGVNGSGKPEEDGGASGGTGGGGTSGANTGASTSGTAASGDASGSGSGMNPSTSGGESEKKGTTTGGSSTGNGVSENGPSADSSSVKSGDKAGAKTTTTGASSSSTGGTSSSSTTTTPAADDKSATSIDSQRNKAKRGRLGTESDLDRRKSELAVVGPLPDRKNAFNGQLLERLVLRQPAEMKAQALEDLKTRASLHKSSLPSSLCFSIVNSGGAHVNNMCFSDDVTMVGASCDDGSFRVWRNDDQPLGTARGAVYHGDMVDSLDEDEKTAVLRGHSSAVYGGDFSPDNRFALTASADSTVRLWSLAAKSNVVIYRSHEGFPVWDVRFGRYGYYFASCSMDRTARLWSTDRMTPLRIFAGHLSDVDCLEFHPNQNYLATGSSDKTVRLWDVQTGKCIRVFTGHFHGVKSLAFSRNGRYLASSGDDQYINIWDLQAGKRLETLVGHRSAVTSLSFSQESTILASSAMDSTVRLWDMQSIADKPAHSVAMAPRQQQQQQSHRHASGAAGAGSSSASTSYVRPIHMVRPSAIAELPPSRFLLKTLRSKQTPIYRVQFTPRNLLLSGGVFCPKADA